MSTDKKTELTAAELATYRLYSQRVQRADAAYRSMQKQHGMPLLQQNPGGWLAYRMETPAINPFQQKAPA